MLRSTRYDGCNINTRQSSLIAVNAVTGQMTATASGSAVNGSAGLYVVRDGVALGLDQGASGDACGYNIGAQRVTLAAAAAGLAWPHYFVDLSGVGGSADPASDLVVIAACAQLAPSSPPSATPSSSTVSAQAATSPASPGPDASPSASSVPGQGCLRPELVALNLSMGRAGRGAEADYVVGGHRVRR